MLHIDKIAGYNTAHNLHKVVGS